MPNDRLSSDVWIMAHVRRCNSEGIPAMVLRHGDDRAGALILKLNRLDGTCRVLTQATDLDGALGWLGALGGDWVAEADADAYIDRQVTRDRDLWVVEIEHKDGWHPFEGKVL